MTKLLISVRHADEALIAAQHGADIVDVKEPRHGSLGFAGPDVICDVVRALRRRSKNDARVAVPISIAMGELENSAHDLTAHARLPEDVWSEICYAKVGCRDCSTERWWLRWQTWRRWLPPHVIPVAVAYADHVAARSPLPEDVLKVAIAGGANGFLLDTFGKKSSHLFDFFSASRLDSLIHCARHSLPIVAVAGSLRGPDLFRVLSSNPPIVGIRGAACEGGRDGAISAVRVRRLADALREIRRAKTVS